MRAIPERFFSEVPALIKGRYIKCTTFVFFVDGDSTELLWFMFFILA